MKMVTLQQALALHQAGHLLEAEQAYRAVLETQPRQADALSLLGVVLEALGRPQEAVGFIRQAVALDPKAGIFRLHLGNALLAAGEVAAAVNELRFAIRLQPQLAEAQYNLGNALKTLGENDAAIAAYRACLHLQPAAHEARNNMALLISARGDYAGAYQAMEIILAADPANLKARVNYANIADEAGHYDISHREAERAVIVAPRDAEALFALALAKTRLGYDKAALQLYARLLSAMPSHAKAWDNYAQILQAHALWDEASLAYQRALALTPQDADICYHSALFDLLMGHLTQGFKGYDWRFKAVPLLKRIVHSTAPLWDGTDPRGQTILIADEQGFGDSLMFCRFLPLLRACGARVIYACRAPLLSLLQGWNGVDVFVPFAEAANTPCDAHASMMDLPYLLRMGESVPSAVPYITAPDGGVPTCVVAEKKLKVGVVWAGNPQHKHDHRRSIPYAVFRALFQGMTDVPVQFYNLLRPADLRANEQQYFAVDGVCDLGAQITDFATTARFIAALDVVIAVDTSTVHLAGALGKPVWVLLPLGPDWRWQINRSDSPWYPTARLYRQETADDWASVLQQVKADLRRLAVQST